VKVIGRTAVGSERERLWQRWREIDKNLDSYAALRPHETGVVVFEPRTGTDEPRFHWAPQFPPARQV